MSKVFSAAEKEGIAREFREILGCDPWDILEGMRLDGTIVLNSDDLFMSLPRYRENPEERVLLGSVLYPIAKETTNRLFQILLRKKETGRDIVVFTSGGSAVGKSTLLRVAAAQDDAAFIVDTTLSEFQRANAMISAARKAKFLVEVHYIFRPFADCVRAMVKRALDPKSGRMVPIDDMASTHSGSQLTLIKLAEAFADDSSLTFNLHQSIDNALSRLTPKQFVARLHPSIDELQRSGDSLLHGLREKYRRSRRSRSKKPHALHFGRAFYEAARSKAQKSK